MHLLSDRFSWYCMSLILLHTEESFYSYISLRVYICTLVRNIHQYCLLWILPILLRYRCLSNMLSSKGGELHKAIWRITEFRSINQNYKCSCIVGLPLFCPVVSGDMGSSVELLLASPLICLFVPENLSSRGDVIKWKHFPRYWSFVREIHRSHSLPL